MDTTDRFDPVRQMHQVGFRRTTSLELGSRCSAIGSAGAIGELAASVGYMDGYTVAGPRSSATLRMPVTCVFVVRPQGLEP